MASSPPLLTYAAIGVAIWWSWPMLSPYVNAALYRMPQGRQQSQHNDGGGDGRFFRGVVGNINREWTDIFRAEGRTYRTALPPWCLLYSGATRAPCEGEARSGMGPFYCPPDQKIYIDPSDSWASSSTSLATAAAIPASFVMAAVVAHEIGHHVQCQLGISGRGGPATELQADCFAGVWAKHENDRLIREGKPALIEPGDVEAAVRTAGSMGGGNGSHGSGAQRAAWLSAGLRQGTVAACSTSRS
jgi:uncharacterized protein